MRKYLVILALLLTSGLTAQSFQPFVNSLFATPAAQRQARVDSFMSATTVFPVIEYDTVANFVLTGNYSNVKLAGDMNGWNQNANGFTMMNIPSTNFFFITKYYEDNARLDYKFVTNGTNWILDPNNPNQAAGGFGPNSELRMPGYVLPWETETYSTTQKGGVITNSFVSSIMNSTYQVQVYLPYAYDSTKSYPTVYFQDGTDYINLGDAINVLDNLIDSGLVEPVIGVFVKPNNRNEEYAFSLVSQFASFFTQELVPWVDANWSTAKDSSRRMIMGDSFGGNISMYICLTYPDVFYRTGQHSGAWWPQNYAVLSMYATTTYTDLPMASVWGTYESLDAMWDIVVDSSAYYGYTNKWFQSYPEGHSWGFWRATTDDLLIQLMPGPAVISIPEFPSTSPISLYPNPAVHEVYLEGAGSGMILVFSASGKLCLETWLQEQEPLDVSALRKGLYWIRFGDKSVPLVIE